MYKCLVVPVGKTTKEREFQDLDEILAFLNIKESFETMQFESGYDGVGLIANDQTLEGLKMNRLGVKGDFVLIGMERLQEGQIHRFESLTEKQLSDVRLGVTLQSYKDIMQIPE